MGKVPAVPEIDLATVEFDEDLVRVLSKRICVKHTVLPVKRANGVLTIAMARPTDMTAVDYIAQLTRLRVEIVSASEASIKAAIEKYYPDLVG